MARGGGGRRRQPIANQPTGVWFDRISAIAGNGSATTGSMGLVHHLNEAVTQDAANGSAPLVFQIVIYDLPGRDCSALASNGELGPDGAAALQEPSTSIRSRRSWRDPSTRRCASSPSSRSTRCRTW